MRELFLNCLTTHSPTGFKDFNSQIFGLFYIISSQVIYIDQILHSYTCYAKLRAILNLFSFFFIHPVYVIVQQNSAHVISITETWLAVAVLD